MTHVSHLAGAIRKARKQAGLSQEELAAQLGIRQSSISQWERGTTTPSTQHLLRLVATLGRPLAALLINPDDCPPFEQDHRSGPAHHTEPSSSEDPPTLPRQYRSSVFHDGGDALLGGGAARGGAQEQAKWW